MTGNLRPPVPGGPLDDAAIAQLVREVADGWTLPPQRLDAPSWRDRVRSDRTRRLSSAGGWFARVGQAATAAIALTVVGALLAVLITRPPQDPAASPVPSAGSTPRATEPLASLLPLHYRDGELPDPSIVLVQQEGGDFALVNLADGTIGDGITGTPFGSQVRVRADGKLVCLCIKESGTVGGSPTRIDVSFDVFDADGRSLSSVAVESRTGVPDPRDADSIILERPPHVQVGLGFSADGRYGFVGWTFRDHPAWRNGVTVVDLQDGSVVSRMDLPDGTTGDGDARRVVDAPRVVGSNGANGLLVARGGYEWSPATSEDPNYLFESDLFLAKFANGQLSDAAAMPLAAEECGRNVQRAGPLADGGTWLSCTSAIAPVTIVRRLSADGGLKSNVGIPADEGIDGETTALSPDGSALFVWDPSTASITRIDLATGERTDGSGLSALVDDGPLAAFGRWLAPAAAAKSFLRGAIVVSPDGTRIYAVGIKEGVGASDQSGSAGVFVFDAASLDLIAIWQPTADFVSLALSADGRYAYVAGLPGVDALGRVQREQKASITVFETSTGSIRLIAGALDGDMITFATPTLD